MNAAEILPHLLPHLTYFLAVIPLVVVTKHLFAYLAERNRERSRLERLTRSLEGTDPQSRAEILRALGQQRKDDHS
ncbi:hypothetical protein [Glycomyces xiaoerkulensis]|uniref:hypothetical protein n=1 Tax=Glycomyces xiaoerkulensis TaxID=2038139 RepID=UPI000C257648|nr:hypothetical protein [Glycomyces xiaoerkulensis]